MRSLDVSEGRLWETGSPGRNTADVQVVCGPSGEKLTPVWSEGCRAGFRPEPGMLIIQIERPGGGQEPKAVVSRYEGDETFTLVVEGTFQDIQVSEELVPALNAAMDKAEHYHCNCVHWANEPQRRR